MIIFMAVFNLWVKKNCFWTNIFTSCKISLCDGTLYATNISVIIWLVSYTLHSSEWNTKVWQFYAYHIYCIVIITNQYIVYQMHLVHFSSRKHSICKPLWGSTHNDMDFSYPFTCYVPLLHICSTDNFWDCAVICTAVVVVSCNGRW
jgi:hypothetical protein